MINMAQATVHSKLCGFTHMITSKKDGENVLINIQTDCEKIKKMSPMVLSVMELFDIKENPVMNKAQELKCSSNCLVPCGVLNVSRIEAGFLAESLCRKVGSLSITFD